MHLLKLNALRVFEAAASSGSFRAASDRLGLTPSAVSHAIRGLELSLQAPLFLREARKISLTAQGETLLRHVRHAFEELQRGVSAVSGRKRLLLRLHSAPSFAAQWLVPRLPGFLAEHPELELHVAASVSYSRFHTGEFDADILYGAYWAGEYARLRQPRVTVLPLCPEMVTPACSPALAERIREPADLLGQVLIVSDNKEARWPDWFAANGLPPPEVRGPRFDRSFLSLSAAADGLGVALESPLLAQRELASGRLVQPLHGCCQDVADGGHWLAFPEAQAHRRELSIFTRWLGAELGVALDPGGTAGPG